MENYNSYPESGGSTPRSLEIDFDNPPPWDDQSTNYKVKLMISYCGKIQPRPHDNQLAYIGGETKILAVERSIKFAYLATKLSAITDSDVTFKYQLPGEDLDALISVTNDDDLYHMMNEYDRLNRASPKHARLRLFLFPLDALNSGPVVSNLIQPGYGNADFLFGSEKLVSPPVPVQHKGSAALVPDHDLRRLPISEDQQLQQQQQQQQMMYRNQSEDGMTSSGYGGGDFYVQQQVVATTLPGSVVSQPPGYQISSGGFTGNSVGGDQQQLYMVPNPAFHAPMPMHVTGPIGNSPSHGPGQGNGQGHMQLQGQGQGYYAVYNNGMQHLQPQPQPQPQPQKIVTQSGGIRMVQPTAGMTDQGYGQVAYDNGVGRHVYYTP